MLSCQESVVSAVRNKQKQIYLQELYSLVPRPLPDFISQSIFLHGCKIKSGSDLGTRLGAIYSYVCVVIVDQSQSCIQPDWTLLVRVIY